MIEYVQNFLETGKFFYLDTENNQIFLDEHKKYRWDENTIHDEIPKVEMELLQKQLKVMKTYEEVLIKRIELSMEEMAKGE